MIAVVGQVGDDAAVLDVEVAAIGAAGLQRLDDVAGVLVGALVVGERLAGLLEELREVGLEPVAVLGGVAQVAAGLAVDPVGHVDPAVISSGRLRYQGRYSERWPFDLGRVEAEALQHVDAHLLLLRIDRMRSKAATSSSLPIAAAVAGECRVPGLVVDAGAEESRSACGRRRGRWRSGASRSGRRGRGRSVSTPPWSMRGPGVHRHRVGVVQELRAGLGDLADVPAEVEGRRDVALAVHDAAGADGVADALVDAVFQRDADVVGEGLEPADADAADDVARAFERFAAVGGGGDSASAAGSTSTMRRMICLDHVEVVGADVGQRDLDVRRTPAP